MVFRNRGGAQRTLQQLPLPPHLVAVSCESNHVLTPAPKRRVKKCERGTEDD